MQLKTKKKPLKFRSLLLEKYKNKEYEKYIKFNPNYSTLGGL